MSKNSPAKVGVVSLGCPKNQVDAEMMLRKLRDAGFKLVPEAGLADVVIINTCGFIQAAKEEAIEEILEAVSRKNDRINKRIIVTGCLAERYREQVLSEFPEVDAVLGLAANADIVDAVNTVLLGESLSAFPENGCMALEGGRLLSTAKHYAYLRIADGCDNRCSYCSIPAIRGGYRSREEAAIVSEAEQLARDGVRELVLIAQDVTYYGKDLYGIYKLPALLDKLCEIPELKWIRLLYCYPERITDELISVIRTQDKIVKYLDLPIQHCDGAILRRMNRPGNEETLRSLIGKLRQEIPGIILRTTFITGFPGESDDDFNKLARFADDMRFERMGCFAYSREEDTLAAEFPDQIDEDIKQKRADILESQQDLRMAEYFQTQIGATTEIVCEGYDRVVEMFIGRDWRYAPEIDGVIYFTAEKNAVKTSEFVSVKITDALDNNLIGELI